MQVTSDILLSGSTNNAVNTVVAEEEYISNTTGNPDFFLRKYSYTFIDKIKLDKHNKESYHLGSRCVKLVRIASSVTPNMLHWEMRSVNCDEEALNAVCMAPGKAPSEIVYI